MAENTAEAMSPLRQIMLRQHFATHLQWCQKASSWLTKHPDYNDGKDGRSTFRATCFDNKGRLCLVGADFKRAEDEQAFPVYWVWPDQVGPILLEALDDAYVIDDLRNAAATMKNHFISEVKADDAPSDVDPAAMAQQLDGKLPEGS